MNDAEMLLRLANLCRPVQHQPFNIIETAGPTLDWHLAQVRLALDFARMAPVIRMRAVVEDWPLPRIVAEIY